MSQTTAMMVSSGLVCRRCYCVIDGKEPGFQRLCERCAGTLASRPKTRRRDTEQADLFDADDLPEDDLIAEDMLEQDA